MKMLDEYKRKRNFKATPEPNGNKNPNDENSIITDNIYIPNKNKSIQSKPRFVIQKHELQNCIMILD